jgi:biotin transporter BioY
MRTTFSPRQVALLIAPPGLLAGMYLTYRGFVSLIGPKGGYLAGFLFYWAF